MINGKKILAIIPARGGSKGLPGKNIKKLGEKALIGWTIEAGLASSYIDKLIVSTDDLKIAGIAREFGANLPFQRPAELATDNAKSIDTLFHAIDWFSTNTNDTFDLILLLQPTSPLRSTKDIDKALRKLLETKGKAVVSVCPCEHHPWWANELPADHNMKEFLRPEIANTNRQALPAYYRLNGAIYIAEPAYLRENDSFLGEHTYSYEMPLERSVDIDSALDFKLAEVLIRENQDHDMPAT